MKYDIKQLFITTYMSQGEDREIIYSSKKHIVSIYYRNNYHEFIRKGSLFTKRFIPSDYHLPLIKCYLDVVQQIPVTKLNKDIMDTMKYHKSGMLYFIGEESVYPYLTEQEIIKGVISKDRINEIEDSINHVSKAVKQYIKSA